MKTEQVTGKQITEILASQHKAGLQMLRQAIEKTPPEHWASGEFRNPIWQIAYHALWGVKFYLGADPESYEPWEGAIEGAESLGGAQEWENPEEGVLVDSSHTKEELLAFIDRLEKGLHEAIEVLPLDGDSGFEWYPFTRLELHINTIRHLQHHTAQIIERLKGKGISGFPWAIDGNPPQEWEG